MTNRKRRKIHPLWLAGLIPLVAVVLIGFMIVEARRQRALVRSLEAEGASITFSGENPFDLDEGVEDTWLPEWIDIGYASRVRYLHFKERVDNLDFLWEFPKLTSLELVGDPTKQYDLRSIGQLVDLQQLSLQSVHSNDFSPLSTLTEVKYLSLYDCNFNEVSHLSRCSQLRSLKLTGCPIESLSEIRHLRKIETLIVDDTELKSLSDVSGMVNLHILSASGTSVRDLTPVSNLPYLTELVLSHTEVDDIGPLRGVPLWSLFLEGTNVSDLEPLAKPLRSLSFLSISQTKVTNLQPLAKHHKLKRLDCSRTKVSNADVLADKRFLDEVDVSSTAVTDLSAFFKWEGTPGGYFPKPAVLTVIVADTKITSEHRNELSQRENLRIVAERTDNE